MSCRELLDAARAAGVPIFFTTIVYDDVGEAAAAVFLRKVPALKVLRPGTRWVEIDERLGRRDDEPIIVKAHASAFFGVPFASMLAGRDTLVVCGASTSGCVRATVVDAMQHGLAPIVPASASATATRAPTSRRSRTSAAATATSWRYGKLPARCRRPGSGRSRTPDSHSATPIRASRSTPVSTPSPSSR